MREQRPWDCAILGLVHSLRIMMILALLLFAKKVDKWTRIIMIQGEN